MCGGNDLRSLKALSLRGDYSLWKSDMQWGYGRTLLKDLQMLVWVSQEERVYGDIHKVKD